MVAVFGDIEQMTETSFLLLTNTNQALKIYVFMFNGPRVRRLIKSLEREEFQPKTRVQYETIVEEIKMSKMITKVFLFMCLVTCCLWGIFPFLDRRPGESIRLPLSGWYPFDTNRSPIFELVYVYQIFATWINGMGNITMDTFLSGCIMIISSQLAVLNEAFRIIKLEEQDCGEIQQKRNSTKSLVRNIRHYKNIIQFADEMTALFSVSITSQFAVSVIIICMTMFQMSLVSPVSLQFLSMLLYQACILLEIFLWCYYGNEVIVQSEKLTESAYTCEWIDAPKEFKQNLLFFMTRTQFPLKLYAGGYFTLSLTTYMAILKSSWSYFAVLNSVHSQQIS
ncbi:odorant receptor Or1-like [Tenebrio molitor]|uniref:odorant receptor Or1-like n=1 Tax=Tenebrio molitor TaxID=7067 RepID=UPI003624817B